MKLNRLLIFFIGLIAACAYDLMALVLIKTVNSYVSISYVFILPIILGVIPVVFTTREQLKSYYTIILLPWFSTITFCVVAILCGFEGAICLIIIIGPFMVLGTLGAFISRLYKLKFSDKKTPLYSSLLLPLILIFIEGFIPASNQFNTVTTTIKVKANRNVIWTNIKNVRNIKKEEIETHFIHLIGIPKPLNGELNRNGIGATRSITWEKGIKFQERISGWEEGVGFKYNIIVDSNSIPPTTLDEHVMIGGRYFDVTNGSYEILPINNHENVIKLTCRYRITSNLNFYGKWWADYIMDDFNEMILEVIKKRCENKNSTHSNLR
ncbi:hypothetical protein [Mucilaginibacter glaciei]|uniref:Polyketide cyclase/dehydrase/lipid transport protein n=1 Tax=Mucilaginibacter glaciei TaxID=2772109 RepID=A0A926NYP9_9SPHI|nr:hypothetical protein [Mucilaginibacter glaciei]MBD1394333.1 hypothetical protein [Mucilaginibacter glaciei]